MYTPKINENQIQRLYRLRESLRDGGEKATMTAMVRDAVEKYLIDNESEKKRTKADINNLIEHTNNI